MAQLRKNSTIGGKQIATEEQLCDHADNNNIHVSTDDKLDWDNKITIKISAIKPEKANFWFKIIK